MFQNISTPIFYFKVDIRDLKRMKRFGALENSDLSTCLSNENKTIVNHLLEKLGQVEEDDSTGKISSIMPVLFLFSKNHFSEPPLHLKVYFQKQDMYLSCSVVCDRYPRQ